MTQALHNILDTNEIALLLDLANLACQKGLPAEARTLVDGVLAVQPDFAPALITLAYSHIVVDDFDKALEILAPVLEKQPEDADARIMQGMALLLSGRKNEAEESFAHISDNCKQKILASELLNAL